MSRMRAYYMVVRYVPQVFREEFINVGVLLFCSDAGYQGIRTLKDFASDARMKAFEGASASFVRPAVNSLVRAIESNSVSELFGHLDHSNHVLEAPELVELQRMYSANNLQLTPARTVITTHPAQTLEKLFQDFVGKPVPLSINKRVNLTVIRKAVKRTFQEQGLFDLGLQEDFELPLPIPTRVDLAYKNHVWHCYQAMSFAAPDRDITKDVNAYRQTLRDARESNSDLSDAHFTVLSYTPEKPVTRVEKLLDALRHDQIEVIPYQEVGQLVFQIRSDLEQHALMN